MGLSRRDGIIALASGTPRLTWLSSRPPSKGGNRILDLHNNKRGRFRRFGVSNFPAWGVMQVYYKCKELGYRSD